MSVLVVVIVVVAVLLVLFFVGGLYVSRRRLEAPDYAAHVAAADRALEEARAADRGWDRELLERAAREALASERPGSSYTELHLVLVDDRPGMTEDRAHFVAVGADGQARLVLTRAEGGDWILDRIE
jgi:hypothetical protein